MGEYWITFPAGIIISTIVSALGIGGGILWMPFLLLILNLRPETAVLTSLLIQTAGKGSGAFAYFRQGRVDSKLAFFILAVAVPGIGAGAWTANQIESSHMELILGILILTTALLFVSSNQSYKDMGGTHVNVKKMYRYSWLTVLVSFGSGMLSTGIGEWLIPIMRTKLSLKMSHAIATCIFITFGMCLIGVVIHSLIGSGVDLMAVMWGVPGVIIGGQTGPRITSRIDERLLKEIFIFLLTLVGIHLIYNSY